MEFLTNILTNDIFPVINYSPFDERDEKVSFSRVYFQSLPNQKLLLNEMKISFHFCEESSKKLARFKDQAWSKPLLSAERVCSRRH